MSKSTLKMARDVLLNALSVIRNGVERRQLLPILSYVLLESDGNHITLTGTNLEISAATVIDVAGEPMTIAVPAEKLYNIVRLLPEGSEVTMTQQPDRVTVRSGSSSFKLNTMPAADFPKSEPLGDVSTWSFPESTLTRLLHSVSFAMASDDVRYYLNGALLEIADRKVRAVATNGHRLSLSVTDIGGPAKNTSQILPRQAVLVLLKILGHSEDEVSISLGERAVEFRKGSVTLRSKLIDGTYPAYDRVIPSTTPNRIEIQRDSFLDAIRRVAIISDDRSRAVRFTAKKGSLVIASVNSQEESSQETLEVNYDGADVEVGFNAGYIIDALETLPEHLVHIGLGDSRSAAVITGKESQTPLFVVMPVAL